MRNIEIFAEEPRRHDRYEDLKLSEKLVLETFGLNVNAANGFHYEYSSDSENHYILSMAVDK